MSTWDQAAVDPAKVRALIEEHEAEVTAQQLLVDRLDELLDQEQRELRRRQRRVDEIRAAWVRRGVAL